MKYKLYLKQANILSKNQLSYATTTATNVLCHEEVMRTVTHH